MWTGIVEEKNSFQKYITFMVEVLVSLVSNEHTFSVFFTYLSVLYIQSPYLGYINSKSQKSTSSQQKRESCFYIQT